MSAGQDRDKHGTWLGNVGAGERFTRVCSLFPRIDPGPRVKLVECVVSGYIEFFRYSKQLPGCKGIVLSRYRPFQNWEAFKFCDRLLNDGVVTYEAAGAMKDGRIVWLLCRLAGVSYEVAEGDQVDGYGLFYIGHDGTRAATFMPTGVRVVCWNTFSIAEAQGADRMLRIRHTQNLDQQVEQARAMLGLAGKQFGSYIEESRTLAATKIDDAGFHAYVDEMIPPPLTGPIPPHRERIRSLINDLYFNDPRQNLPSIGRTAWAAVNAFTHFVDHEMKARGKTPEQKSSNILYSVWLGRGNQIKQKAMSTAIEMFA